MESYLFLIFGCEPSLVFTVIPYLKIYHKFYKHKPVILVMIFLEINFEFFLSVLFSKALSLVKT
jgi:hypothetical protein